MMTGTMSSQAGTQLGTRPPDQHQNGSGDEELPTLPVMESLLLSVAHFWSRKETADRVIKLIERHFRQDEMFSTLKDLMKMKKPKERQQSAGRTACKAQALDVHGFLVELGDKNMLPRLVVGSEDLERVHLLLSALSVVDDCGVAARLEMLEQSHRGGMEELERMMASMMRGATVPATEPQVIVTPPDLQSFSAVVAGGGVGGDLRARGAGPSAVPRVPGHQPPFLNRGMQEGGLQAGQGRQQRQDRSSSASNRQRTDEEGAWQDQRAYGSGGRSQQRANWLKAQVVKGSSTEYAELVGPVTWWIGKCRPDVTKEKVKEVLKKLAVDKCGATDFIVESVHILTNDLNPWSRWFKVSVPTRLHERMRDPRMYPLTWESRP